MAWAKSLEMEAIYAYLLLPCEVEGQNETAIKTVVYLCLECINTLNSMMLL